MNLHYIDGKEIMKLLFIYIENNFFGKPFLTVLSTTWAMQASITKFFIFSLVVSGETGGALQYYADKVARRINIQKFNYTFLRNGCGCGDQVWKKNLLLSMT